MDRRAPKIPGMARSLRNARRRARPTPAPLFIGEWIRALGMRPADVARATGRNEGYLSELVNNKKKNPSLGMQQEIAEVLGIPVHYFQRPPPRKDFIEEARQLDPAVIDRLRRQ